MTKTKKTWELICRHEGGHKYFRHMPSGRVGVADNSGWTPDRTEDGILWLDLGRPVRVGRDGCDLPLIRDSTGEKCYTADPLLSGLRACDDLGLRIELSGDLGPALPLIVKLLDGRALVA